MSEMNLESYPPLFRHENTTKINPKTTHDNIDNGERREDKTLKQNQLAVSADHHHDPLPLIDLQYLNHERLEEACKDWGVFRLVNHGIPDTLLRKLEELARKMFSLPFEYKNEVVNGKTPLSYFWGTPALTSSGASPLYNINWVEGFNVPLCQLSQFQAQDPLLDSFRLSLEEYGNHLARIATTIFQAMTRTLNLNPDESKPYLSESTGYVRVYRYPKRSQANHETMGMEAHTDSSVLSILNSEQVGGLELLKDGKWLHVQPIPHSLTINLGDMMQAISNDEFKSVIHRVKAKKDEERLSICYFVFPGEESVIKSSNYRPFTYKDFQKQVQQDIKTLGFKVGLDKFKHFHPSPEAAN